MSYKIIESDNFARGGDQPGYDDKLLLVLRCKETAQTIVRLVHEDDPNPGHPYYYHVEDGDYRLKRFEA